MARGFSKAIIVGNITRDPELRSTPSGAQVCSFSVAVNRNYKDSSGANQESVSFIDCTAWGRAGEIIAQYAKKGSGILVSGRLEQRSWEDKEGQKRSRVEIVVEDFNLLAVTLAKVVAIILVARAALLQILRMLHQMISLTNQSI